MSLDIEIFGEVRNRPLKGHDRLFIDTDRSFAAALDGAGGDELSHAVVRALPSTIRKYETLRKPASSKFLLKLLAVADNLPEAQFRTATAAIACVDKHDSVFQINFANVGDSSIYLYDRTADLLKLLAHTPTSYSRAGGPVVQTGEFLGNCRRESKLKYLVGSLVVPATAEWALLGFSDGVQDDSGKGIQTDELKEIAQTLPASDVPAAVLDAINPYDDASIFIMSNRVEK